MARTFESPDWRTYKMSWTDPHRQIEPLGREIEVIDAGLAALVQAGVLPHRRYDRTKMLAHREAVRARFDIPWTAISPRMQRLLYAVNAIAQPETMVAVGIFCGNTFISNAGAAVGPGATYQAKRLVGIEIRPREAARARRNVEAILTDADRATEVEIAAADGIPWLRAMQDPIDLLYLDADGPRGSAKSIYLDLLLSATHALRPGSLVVAHNSVNAAVSMADYLAYVRDPNHFAESVNMIVDDQGIEISRR